MAKIVLLLFIGCLVSYSVAISSVDSSAQVVYNDTLTWLDGLEKSITDYGKKHVNKTEVIVQGIIKNMKNLTDGLYVEASNYEQLYLAHVRKLYAKNETLAKNLDVDPSVCTRDLDEMVKVAMTEIKKDSIVCLEKKIIESNNITVLMRNQTVQFFETTTELRKRADNCMNQTNSIKKLKCIQTVKRLDSAKDSIKTKVLKYEMIRQRKNLDKVRSTLNKCVVDTLLSHITAGGRRINDCLMVYIDGKTTVRPPTTPTIKKFVKGTSKRKEKSLVGDSTEKMLTSSDETEENTTNFQVSKL